MRGNALGRDGLGVERGALSRQFLLPLGETGFALRGVAPARHQRVAPRILGGDPFGEGGEFGVERGDVFKSQGERCRRIALRRRLLVLRRDERGALGLEAGEGRSGIGGKLVLARGVGGELDEAGLGGFARTGDAALFLFEGLARQGQALQLGRGRGLGLAQRGQLAGGGFAGALGRQRGGRAVGDGALGRVQPLDRQHRARRSPLASADAAPPPRRGGCGRRAGDSAAPGAPASSSPRAASSSAVSTSSSRTQIGLGRLEAKLGLMPARMQPGDARGLLEQAAALARLLR